MRNSLIKMLLLLPISAAVIGCAGQPPDPTQLRADETTLVQATVADPARAERLLALLDERDGLIEETIEMLQQYRRELRAINADYDARREIIIEMVDQYNRDRAHKQLRFIDLITKMKATTTADEWKVIAEFQLDNFKARQLVFGRAKGRV
jgi:hypothetical protein